MIAVLHANTSLISCTVMLYIVSRCRTVEQNHHPDPFSRDNEQHGIEYILQTRIQKPQPSDQSQQHFLPATI